MFTANSQTVKQTTFLSIIVQFLTGLVLIAALVSGRGPRLLRDVLAMEAVVQFIEFIFYMYIVRTLKSSTGYKTMAAKRYIDWIFTTPTMLVALAAYFQHEFQVQTKSAKHQTILEFIKTEKYNLITMVLANTHMIIFGALGELGYMSIPLAMVAGFVAYIVAFMTLFQYTKGVKINQTLFWIVAVVWTIYGFVFALPAHAKNISYNGLDLIAKNFFGTYLSIKILQDV